MKGKFTDTPGHLLNIMPTILEATGASYPHIYDGHTIQPLKVTALCKLS